MVWVCSFVCQVCVTEVLKARTVPAGDTIMQERISAKNVRQKVSPYPINKMQQKGQKPAKKKTRAEKLADLRAGRSTNRYYAGDRKLEAEKAAKARNKSLTEEELQRVTPQPLTDEAKEAISKKHGLHPDNIGRYGNYKPTEAELNAKLKAWSRQREQRGENLSGKLKALETKEHTKVNQQTPEAWRKALSRKRAPQVAPAG
ncbi:MAG: hypothetical protein ACPG7U_02160 [Holosporaceae bacterium]